MNLLIHSGGKKQPMRADHRGRRRLMSMVTFLLLGMILLLAAPCKTFAADGDGEPTLQERHVWFSYGYTECTGTVHPLSKDIVYSTESPDAEFPREYMATMMICDTGHILHAEGDGITEDNVTYESLSPSVMDIDSTGNVKIIKTGTARIKAAVAADDTYDGCTVYLTVKVDRHDAWIGPELLGFYEDRPRTLHLDLDTSDGPHQIANNLRPGASFVRFESSDPGIAYVDQNGMVTPVSAGTTNILIETDDGGGKYKANSFGTNITVTGEDILIDQEISGNLGPFEIDDYRSGVQLDLHAETPLEYSSIGSDSEYVSVDQSGFVTFTKSAASMIHVVAPPNETYKPAVADIHVSALDPQPQRVWRNVTVSYGCTECDGTVRPCTNERVSRISPGATEYFLTTMMMCDTDHVIRVTGDGLNGTGIDLTSENPNILVIDSDGNVTLKNTGTAIIRGKIPGDETYAERTVKIEVVVDRHDSYYTDVPFHYVGRAEDTGLFINTADGPQQVEVPLRPGAGVISFTSDDPTVASIDKNGVVTPISPGYTVLNFTFSDGGGKYKTQVSPKRLGITVRGEDTRAEQKITGNLGPFTVDWHDGLALDLNAQTDIQYSVSGTGSPSVDSNGAVKFRGEGTATVKAVAVKSVKYKPAEVVIKITAVDRDKERTAMQAAENTALLSAITMAQSLQRPSLKVKARKGRKNKLTWSQVPNADGYIVYVKYPGKKKYVAAITRGPTVKSVVHKGLSKRKVYRYKVRAFKQVNGVTYYGPFSKARKGKAK